MSAVTSMVVVEVVVGAKVPPVMSKFHAFGNRPKSEQSSHLEFV